MRSAFVWSTGLEEWDPIFLSNDDYLSLSFCYQKQMHGVVVGIYKDSLGRFICVNSL